MAVVLGFVSALYSNLSKYNYLVQVYGRVIHTISFWFFFIFKLLRVFGTLVVHPFSNSMNEWIFLIYIIVFECQSLYMNLFITSMSLAWTCGLSTQEIILPRLKYIGEFLFTSPKQSKMNLLCSLSGARLRTTSVEWFPINFRPYIESLWWLDLFMGLPYTTFFRPRFGR